MSRRWLTALVAVAALLPTLVSCSGTQPLVQRAGLSTTSLTPSGADRADLSYVLTRPAEVSIALTTPTGELVELRAAEPRPAAGAYTFGFDGTIPSPSDARERRVLPDGAYELRLDARDGDGRQSLSFDLTITGADTSPPAIENLAVYPTVVTPNFDGVDDVASVTYRLTKRARVVASATDASGSRVHLGTQELLEPGEYRELWDGLYKERPLPDGAYEFSIRATDLAGNVAVARVPVTLATSGRPDARILRFSFAPRRVMLGDELTVEATVKNVGTVPLRTQGPPPGFVYSSFESFSAIANQQFVDRVGVWRLGVDWAGSPVATGSKYPYRWGLGRDLAPGEETTVSGRIRIEHGPNLDRLIGPPTNRFFFYGGLIHEGIAFQDDKVGGTWIEVDY